MKILFICPYTPYPLTDGGKVRVYNLIKRLSAKHEIALICFTKSKHEEKGIAELKIFCKKVKAVPRRPAWAPVNFILALFAGVPFVYVVNGFSRDLENIILDELKGNEYDLVQVEHSYAAGSVIRAAKRAEVSVPKILSDHNIESHVYERYLKIESNIIKKYLLAIDIRRMKRAESRIWGAFDACIFASADDLNYFRRIYPNKRAYLIPNGVDIHRYLSSKSQKGRGSMVFVGNFRYIANIDAIRYFIRQIFPLIKKGEPSARFSIIGDDPLERAKKFANDDVRVTGYVEETGYYLSQNQVFVAPLRIGGGTKLKVLEAMAMGLPVVGTSIAFEGLEVKDGENALIAESPERFADAVINILKDGAMRERIGKNARRLIEKNYDWDKIVLMLEMFYAEAAKCQK